jgi:hypothetical protein
VGGGGGAAAPAEADFDGEDLPSSISPERALALESGATPTDDEVTQWQLHRARRALNDEGADQFDIWKLVPRDGQPAYAITWRDCDGRPVKYGGWHNSVEEVRTALAAKYHAVEIWFDHDA